MVMEYEALTPFELPPLFGGGELLDISGGWFSSGKRVVARGQMTQNPSCWIAFGLWGDDSCFAALVPFCMIPGTGM